MVQGDTLSLFLTVRGASAQKLLKISCLGRSLSQLVSPHRQMSVKSVTADHADPPRNHVRWSCRDMELWEICPSIPVPQADAPASSCPCLPPAPPHPLFATSVFIPPSLLSCSLDLSIKPLPSRLLCLTAYAFLFDPFDPHISPTVSFPVYNMSGTEDLLDLCCTASLVVVCVFFLFFCLPCAFGQVMHAMILTEGCTAAVPDRPFLRVATTLWKRPPHKHSLPKTQCGICSTKEAASNILAELSSMWLLSVKALRGKMFPNNFTFSCWNLAHKKRGEKIEELCIFTHAAG